MTTSYAKHLVWCTLLSLSFLSGQAQESPVQIYGEVYFYGNIISDELNECVQLHTMSDPSPTALEIVETIYADIAHGYEYAYKTGTGGNQDEISWYIRRDVDPRYSEKLVIQISGAEGWLCNLVYDYLNHYATQGCIQWAYLLKADQDRLLPLSYNYRDPTSSYGSTRSNTASLPAAVATPQALDLNLTTPRYLKNSANRPTTEFTLPAQPFQQIRNIDKVYSLLTSALQQCGYTETAYFEHPGGGFELITAMEEMTPDGLTARKVADNKYKGAFTSIYDYLQLLENEPTGFYRFFVFKYDPQEQTAYYEPQRKDVGFPTFYDNLPKSRNTLKSVQVETSSPPASDITLMVYEFERPAYRKGTLLKKTSNLSAEEYLQKTGLWPALDQAYRNL